MQDIIHNCPNICHLVIWFFRGLKTLEISKLEKLETLKMGVSEREIECVSVDAPSLKHFKFISYEKNLTCAINLTSCYNLKSLHLSKCSITDDLFHSYLSTFPLLENIILSGCNMLRRIRISGHRLKSLELSKGELEDIEIDAPNLSKFDFDATEIMPILFSENVTQFTMNVTYSFKPTHGHIDSFWFLKLREFLGVSAQSINLKVCVLHNKVSFDSEDLSEVTIPPLVEVEHLELVAAGNKGPLDSEALIDGLLWSCHPKTTTVRSTNKFEKECIEVLEELLGSDQRICCTSSQVKCWRDALKSAELVEIELPHYLKNLSIADAPLAFTPKVRFRLDWDL